MTYKRILGVGWDVGGWMGKKHGVAIAQWDKGTVSVTWLGTGTVALPKGKLLRPEELATLVAGKQVREMWGDNLQVVVAMDAPLGFPRDYVRLLNGHQVDVHVRHREIDSTLAYRETEREVFRVYGKKPLSGPFDKLGNNSTVAIAHALHWKQHYGYTVPPLSGNSKSERAIIEVYPALSKTANGVVQERLAGFMPNGLSPGTDEYDAAICALLAMAYCAAGSIPGLPVLVDPPERLLDATRVEGWIYSPEVE